MFVDIFRYFADIFADTADKMFSGPSPIFFRYRYFRHWCKLLSEVEVPEEEKIARDINLHKKIDLLEEVEFPDRGQFISQ